MTSIAAVLVDNGEGQFSAALERLASNPLIRSIAAAGAPITNVTIENIHRLRAASLRPSAAMVETLRWFETTDASHLLCVLSPRVEITANGLRRLANVAADTRAAVVYSDFFDAAADGAATLHPLIDYQPGSIRDDFDFGHAVLISRAAVNGLADAIEAEHTASRIWRLVRPPSPANRAWPGRPSFRAHVFRSPPPWNCPPTTPISATLIRETATIK